MSQQFEIAYNPTYLRDEFRVLDLSGQPVVIVDLRDRSTELFKVVDEYRLREKLADLQAELRSADSRLASVEEQAKRLRDTVREREERAVEIYNERLDILTKIADIKKENP